MPFYPNYAEAQQPYRTVNAASARAEDRPRRTAAGEGDTLPAGAGSPALTSRRKYPHSDSFKEDMHRLNAPPGAPFSYRAGNHRTRYAPAV